MSSAAEHPCTLGQTVRLRAAPGRAWAVDGIGWGRYGVYPFGPVVTVHGLGHAVHCAELLPADDAAAIDALAALGLG